jgi:hypothetical protein
MPVAGVQCRGIIASSLMAALKLPKHTSFRAVPFRHFSSAPPFPIWILQDLEDIPLIRRKWRPLMAADHFALPNYRITCFQDGAMDQSRKEAGAPPLIAACRQEHRHIMAPF